MYWKLIDLKQLYVRLRIHILVLLPASYWQVRLQASLIANGHACSCGKGREGYQTLIMTSHRVRSRQHLHLHFKIGKGIALLAGMTTTLIYWHVFPPLH